MYISITLFFISHAENKTTASLINRKTNYSVDNSATAAVAAADANSQYLFRFDFALQNLFLTTRLIAKCRLKHLVNTM